MARTETAYDRVENGMAAALMVTGTPLKKVEVYGAQLSDTEILTLLQQLQGHGSAAVICYRGGETNEGRSGDLTEQAEFGVFVVVAAALAGAATQGDAARVGIYAVLDWVREKLHNVPSISGINNPLLWRGNQRMSLPDQPMHVAAYMVRFRADLEFPDG